jgi:hypothetical protein
VVWAQDCPGPRRHLPLAQVLCAEVVRVGRVQDSPRERRVSKLVLIRARLTDSEWKRIRTLAIKRDTTTADLVADTLRDALLRGAKP